MRSIRHQASNQGLSLAHPSCGRYFVYVRIEIRPASCCTLSSPQAGSCQSAMRGSPTRDGMDSNIEALPKLLGARQLALVAPLVEIERADKVIRGLARGPMDP